MEKKEQTRYFSFSRIYTYDAYDMITGMGSWGRKDSPEQYRHSQEETQWVVSWHDDFEFRMRRLQQALHRNTKYNTPRLWQTVCAANGVCATQRRTPHMEIKTNHVIMAALTFSLCTFSSREKSTRSIFFSGSWFFTSTPWSQPLWPGRGRWEGRGYATATYFCPYIFKRSNKSNRSSSERSMLRRYPRSTYHPAVFGWFCCFGIICYFQKKQKQKKTMVLRWYFLHPFKSTQYFADKNEQAKRVVFWTVYLGSFLWIFKICERY